MCPSFPKNQTHDICVASAINESDIPARLSWGSSAPSLRDDLGEDRSGWRVALGSGTNSLLEHNRHVENEQVNVCELWAVKRVISDR